MAAASPAATLGTNDVPPPSSMTEPGSELDRGQSHQGSASLMPPAPQQRSGHLCDVQDDTSNNSQNADTQRPTASQNSQQPTNSHTSHSTQRPADSHNSHTSHSSQSTAHSNSSPSTRKRVLDNWRNGIVSGHCLVHGLETAASNHTSNTDQEANLSATAYSTNSQRERNLLTSKLRGSASNVDVRVRQLLSFEGCEDLLRGMDLNRMLANRAAIFSHHSGSASTYKLSKSTDHLDAFISHNWSTPRWRKYLCLAFYFNTGIALGVTAAILVALTVAGIQGYLPTHHYRDREWPKTWVFSVVCVPCYLIVLFFARDIIRPFWGGGCVFLDKTCIHQEDVQIQAQGIQKLGAFLRHSERMVICYSSVYMKKLWTVYEVASFLALHPLDRMAVVPVFLPPFVLAIIVMTWIVNAGSHFFELFFRISGLNYQLLLGLLLLLAPYVARRWERMKVQLEVELSSFNIRKTLCACEEDRPVIYANIASLMRETGTVPYGADDDEALDSFEDLVRGTLPFALIDSIGAYGLRYKQLIVISLALSLPQFLDWTPGVYSGMPLRHVATYFFWYFNSIFTLIPFSLYATLLVERRFLHLTGVKDWLYAYLAPAVFVTGPLATFRQLTDMAEVEAREDNGLFLVWSVGSVVLAGFIGIVLNETAVCGWRSTTGRDSVGSQEAGGRRSSSSGLRSIYMERKSKAGSDSFVRWASEHTVCTFPSGRESQRASTLEAPKEEIIFDIDACAEALSEAKGDDDEVVSATYSV